MWSVLLLAICSSLNGDFRPSDCKIICPKNEVYTKVPKPCNTCDHLLGNVPCIDKKCGDPSCQCKPGLYRNHKGKCVTKRQCLETSEPEFCGCDRGEVYLKCGCERNCDNKLVPKSCAYECVSGCFCKKPLVRDAAGKCVKLESCIAGIEQSSQESAVWSIIYDEDDEERNQSSRRSSHKPHGRGKGHFSRKSSSRSSEYDENDEELNQSSRRSSQWVSEQRRGNGRSSSSEEYDEDEEESDQSSRRSSHRSSRHEKDSSEEDDESSTRSSGKGKKCGKNEVIVACVKPKWCNSCEIKGRCKLISGSCKKGCDCKKGFYRDSSERCIRESKCPSNSPPPTCPLPSCDEEGCEINYDAKPCPTCECVGKPIVRCSVPKCDVDCEINYETKPCPSCDCKKTVPVPTCALPVCNEPGCKLNYDTKPCPTCECLGKPPVICNIPKCDVDCEINYETKPCPSCDCKNTGGAPPVSCSPPKCDKPGCRINYKTKPCPSCECRGVSCTLPKCDGPGCELDYETEPCPSCKCEISGAPPILCSPPKCDKPGCRINSETKPCPSCECNEVSCSMPICDGPGCEIDYDTKPCPSCKCENSSPPSEECGKDEEFYECRPTCKNTCENYKAKAPICPLICIKGCACKKGLVKRNDGKCVKPDKCDKIPGNTPHTCSKNEVYKKCGTACPETCAKRGIRPCTKQCVPGCFCRDGFVRNSENKCVNPEKCPKDKCPPNEQYSDCANPCNDCQIKGKCNFLVCNKGCDCIKGHYRDESGKCIPEALCPPKSPSECAPDEQLYDCVPSCSRTCEKVLSKVKIYCSQLCKPGCFCKEGLVKGYDGKCVRPQECTVISVPPPENCGKDEVYNECGSACPPTCSNLGKDQVCTLQCVQGCFCRKGLVRNDQGECVQPDQCPKSLPIQECKKGEEYYECIPTCKNTCENYQAENLICPRICIKGCACRAGLVKRKDGKCVTPEKCDNTPALPNQECKKGEEHYECIPTCKNTCENYQAENPICPRICIKGCACRAGLVKRKDGKCVTPEKCDNTPVPPIQKCGINEEYYDCVPTCKNTCENYNQKNVACPLYCKQGCGCKKGFVRRKDGKCVRPEKCDKKPESCSHEGEEFKSCGFPCEATCSTVHFKHLLKCPKPCKPGCFCKDGLVRDYQNNCIKPENCNKHVPNCDINQEFYECMPICKRTCMTHHSLEAFCTTDCFPGCFCKEGFVMNKDGECVEPEQCPKTNCGLRETYYECMPSCTNVCNPPDACAAVCRPGCFCRKDLVLREDGHCVKREFCGQSGQSTCDINEQYYDCIPDCGNTCNSYGRTDILCPEICKPGCFCKPGLVLNDENKCVKPEFCPRPVRECKNPDQQYYDCIPDCTNTCDNFGKTVACPKICKPGCFCKPGLVLNNENVCVKPKECPNSGFCKDKTMQYYECTPSCKNNCKSWFNPGIRCGCGPPGCFCKQGLVKREDGRCVRPEHCKKTGHHGSDTSGSETSSSSQTTENYDESSSDRTTSRSSSSQTTGYSDQNFVGSRSSQSSSTQSGSQSSQTSGQSIFESSGYQTGSQSSQTSGQSITQLTGYERGSQGSQTSSQSISESSGYGRGSQSSQTLGQSISELSGYQTGSQNSQTSGQSMSESSQYQQGSQISQTLGQSISESSGSQQGSSYQSGQSNTGSSSSSFVSQEGITSQLSQTVADSSSSSSSSSTAVGSISQILQSASESASSSTASQSGSSSQILQAVSESESSATALQSESSSDSESSNQVSSWFSTIKDESSSQTAQSESESLSSATAYQSGSSSQIAQSESESLSSATASQSGSSSQTAQSESESLSSATASQSATRSQRRKSSASSFSSASEKEIEFSQSESSSSSKGSEDQSSQSSSSSSISESSSDSESSNQVSSWFSTVKDDAESGNEQSQSESSYSSSGSQKEESSQNGESTSKSSTWSKGYTDGNKAKDGDDNGGFSSWSSGYKEENGVRTAEWDDSTSSWSSGSKND
nr:zonadhesin isoform X7 [Parasteatoda tepidariorum]